MDFVLILPGTFTMGTENGESWEKHEHQVTITKPFYMGVYEVTQEQYQAMMGKNPSQFTGKTCPVELLTWENATAFCQALSQKTGKTARLPTEAEWEYACRARTRTRFTFGDDDAGLAEYGWCEGNCDGKTHPVGQKRPNAFGLFDMHGNACEWCSDWLADSYDPPDGSIVNMKVVDPTGPIFGNKRVLRGGSWADRPAACRSAARGGGEPDRRNDGAGLRVVIPADEPN
jgi:formylglycine-generating enzyme required for sulfatase activity